MRTAATSELAAPRSAPPARIFAAPSADLDGHASPIRVALADDRALVRHGVRMLLGSEDDIELLAGRGDVASLGRQVEAHRPDVLVLDLGLSSRTAIAAITALRERAPHTQIVVLTSEREPMFARRAMSAGALGFVAKDCAEADLSAAIRAAARG